MSSSQLLSLGSSMGQVKTKRSQSPVVPHLPVASGSHARPPPARPSLPPSASASSSQSAPSRPSVAAPASHLPWPLSDPSVVLFFDPFAERADEVRSGLERLIAPSGGTLNISTTIKWATHILVDAKESREQNASVRARAGNPVFGREHEPIRQTVLALEWVMESFIRGEAAPEDEFEIRDEEPEQVEEAREEEGSGEAEQSDEDDELDERGHRPSDYVFPAYASRGGWLHSEEEELAKFLATNPQDKDKEDGGSIWDQYACKNPRRINSGYCRHYVKRKPEIDALAASIRDSFKGKHGPYRAPADEGETEDDEPDEPGSRSLRAAPIYRSGVYVAPPSPPRRSSGASQNHFAPAPPSGCFNCGRTDGKYWHNIPGGRACGGCRAAHYGAEKRKPGSGKAALKARQKRIRLEQPARSGSTDENEGDDPADGATSWSVTDSDPDSDSDAESNQNDRPPFQQPRSRSSQHHSRPSTSSHRSSKRTRVSSPPPQPVASGSGTSHHHYHPQASAASSSSSASTSCLVRPSASGGSSRPSYPGPRQPRPSVANPPPPPPALAEHTCHFCWSTGAGQYTELEFANGWRVACGGCAGWYEEEMELALLDGKPEEDVRRGLIRRGLEIRKAGKGRA